MPVVLAAFPATLECDTLVFRCIFNKWISGKEISSEAFILRDRPGKGIEKGLSVGNNPQNAKRNLTKVNKIVTLHVGKVRDIKLDVVPTTKTHANIVELPAPTDLEAERFATALLKQCRDTK